MAMTILTGAAFGASLVASGVYQPGIILGQLKLSDWQMLQAFLTATASSSLTVFLFERLDFYHPTPRSPSPLGVFGPYDGNILGGALQGAGMFLSGACPGTVIPQAVVGLSSGLYALAGTFIGGIAWAGFISDLIARRKSLRTGSSSSSATAAASATPAAGNSKLTVYERLGTSRSAGFLGFQALCASVVYLCASYAPVLPATSHGVSLPPFIGGLCIGLAQLLSIVSRKTMLGVSTSFEEAGKYFWWLVNGARGNSGGNSSSSSSRPGSRNLLFVGGMALGTWLLVTFRPEFLLKESEVVSVAPLNAFIGGAFLAIGSRVSGGCTSGHGISGMSMLSVSSFVTIATMFGGGVLLAALFS